MAAAPALAAGTHAGVRHVAHTASRGAVLRGTLITTRRISLGRVLTNGSGRVMYLYTRDGSNVSHCTGVCLALWPRVTSSAKPRAGGGVIGSHLRRIAHNQVTYYGHPLYYFTGDKRPSQAKGEGVQNFFVVSTSGRAIKPKPAGTGGTTVTTRMATYGATNVEVLATSSGYTIYALSPLETPAFACTTGCTTFWPPLLTTGAPVAAGDTIKADLGTVARPGGGTQVTYMSYPLYTYVGDSAPGQANGHGIAGPATDHWYEVTPLYGPNAP
jgi:predicted lipoprotein with Yx(FWY)xxD motif